MRFLGLALLLVAFNASAASDVKVGLKLSPTGSFTAAGSKVNGTAKKNPDGSVSADKIEIPLDSLDTGIAMRTTHMKEKYLEISKYPNATVTDAKGKDGKGTATLELHGVKKPVSGTYKIEGNELVVSFPINVSDYNVGKVSYMGVGLRNEATIDARIPLK